MSIAPQDREYYRLSFEQNADAAEFVAALGRFLDSPRGTHYMVRRRDLEVWSSAVRDGEPVDVYLSEPALAATVEAMPPVRIADRCRADELPDGCMLVMDGQRPT